MYYCIVNPSARSGKGKDIWTGLENKFISAGIDYTPAYTEGPGHASKLMSKFIESADESELPIKVIVLGGDGTLNEAINGITDFDKVVVGYVPIGSSNDFSRDLNYPKEYDDLLKRVTEGKVRRTLDIGKLTYNTMTKPISRLHESEIGKVRYFDVSSGIGFDAAVCEEALSSGTKNFFNKIGLGKLTYGIIAIKQLLKADKIPCDIEFDNGKKVHLSHFLFIATMIHHYEGGGFNFAPKADLTDGKFDLCIVGDMQRAKMFLALPFAIFGHHYMFKGVYKYRTSKIHIKTMLPMWVHTDGEVSVKSDDITLECLKQKLMLMT
ncbi:MAG: YegS/Rv2252/BmrU family lipid kinase [Butyrivibrio sp.]|nr:YegS/Rv2252/BmrU family lipid kinase [Butyrivibrio sp.]